MKTSIIWFESAGLTRSGTLAVIEFVVVAAGALALGVGATGCGGANGCDGGAGCMLADAQDTQGQDAGTQDAQAQDARPIPSDDRSDAAGSVLAPSCSAAPGAYPSAQNVTLSDGTTGATIFYTTDGTPPAHSGAAPSGTTHVYSSAIAVAATETIEAIAFVAGDADSAVSSCAYTIDANGVFTLPAVNTVSLSPGVTYNGGIPDRATNCAMISPSADMSGATDFTAISNAIMACPAEQTVQLAAGNFYIAPSDVLFLKSNVTVRGTVDANGRPITRFLATQQRPNPLFSDFNSGGPDEGVYVDAVPFMADAMQGATSVVLASNPGYVVGELVTVNQFYDDTLWYNAMHFGTDCTPVASTDGVASTNGVNDPCTAANPGTEMNRAVFSQWNHPIGQVLEVQSVSGTGPFTLTFSTPLHSNFATSLQAQVLRHGYYGTPATVITNPDQRIGIENIYAEGGGALVTFINAKYSWVKNCEVFDWAGQAIEFVRSFRCEERDSYVHQTHDPNPGGGGYALAIDWQSSDCLIENNIHWAANKVIVMRASGGGNVVAYNYFMDGFGAGYPTIPEAGLNASHFPGSHMEFFEGNESWNLWGDEVWGNSLAVTFFRNSATGLRLNATGVTSYGSTGTPEDFDHDSGGRVMACTGTYHDNYAFIDNVLGDPNAVAPSGTWSYDATSLEFIVPSIFDIGVDQETLGASMAMYTMTVASTLRHGNWDSGYDNGVVWDSTTPAHAFANSVFLQSAPAFWTTWRGQQGTGPYGGAWPWVDGTTGTTHVLPAKASFNAMMSATTLYCTGPGMPTPCCMNSMTCAQ